MIGYLAINDAWSRKTEGGTTLEATNYLHRVHGYPHPTAFQGIRNAFRAIRDRYDYVARTRGMNVLGHVRILDLAALPIIRFEDLSFEDRRSILVSKCREQLVAPELTAEMMLQQAGDVSVPRVDDAGPEELYAQLQVAERQMQIWTERCAKIRAEFEYVKNATPVQKAKRRRYKLQRSEPTREIEKSNPHEFDDPMAPTQD